MIAWSAEFLLLVAVATGGEAHPGGLNAQGCHTDRRTGTQHCHGRSSPRPQPVAARASGGGGGHYSSCAAARRAGVAPLRRGQPGYSRRLDRDGDGVACE